MTIKCEAESRSLKDFKNPDPEQKFRIQAKVTDPQHWYYETFPNL